MVRITKKVREKANSIKLVQNHLICTHKKAKLTFKTKKHIVKIVAIDYNCGIACVNKIFYGNLLYIGEVKNRVKKNWGDICFILTKIY